MNFYYSDTCFSPLLPFFGLWRHLTFWRFTSVNHWFLLCLSVEISQKMNVQWSKLTLVLFYSQNSLFIFFVQKKSCSSLRRFFEVIEFWEAWFVNPFEKLTEMLWDAIIPSRQLLIHFPKARGAKHLYSQMSPDIEHLLAKQLRFVS